MNLNPKTAAMLFCVVGFFLFQTDQVCGQSKPSHVMKARYFSTPSTKAIFAFHPEKIVESKLFGGLPREHRVLVLGFVDQLLQLKVNPTDIRSIVAFVDEFSLEQARKRLTLLAAPDQFEDTFLQLQLSFNSGQLGKQFFDRYKRDSQWRKIRGLDTRVRSNGNHEQVVRRQKNDSDYLVTNAASLLAMPKPSSFPKMTERIMEIDNPDVHFGVIMCEPLADPLMELSDQVSFGGTELRSVISKCEMLALTYDEERSGSELQIEFVAKDADHAKEIAKELKRFLSSTRSKVTTSLRKRNTVTDISVGLQLYVSFLRHCKLLKRTDHVTIGLDATAMLDEFKRTMPKTELAQQQEAQRESKKDSVRLRKIARACLSFQKNEKSLPDNRPVDDEHAVSWRVKLLPQLGLKKLYDQYDSTQQWDSEHNRQLLKAMPEVFGSSADGKTRFQRIIGSRTHFGNGQQPVHSRKGPDFQSAMIARVGPDKAVPWTQPTDLELKEGVVYDQLGDIGDEFLFAAMNSTSWLFRKKDVLNMERTITGDPYPEPEPELSSEDQLKLDFENLAELAVAQINGQDATGSLLNNAPRKGNRHPVSWRVKACPFMGINIDYRYDEPWDSDHNKTLLERMPSVFGKDKDGKTRFLRPVGEVTQFGDGKQVIKQFNADPKSIHILKVGSSKAVPWTQPIDLELKAGVSLLDQIGQSDGVVPFACMDGSRSTWKPKQNDQEFENRIRGVKK